MTKKKLPPQQPQRVRINFGARTRYRPEKDDVPVHDRGRSNKPFRPTGLDDYDAEDEDSALEGYPEKY